MPQRFQLVDPARAVLARGSVQRTGRQFVGTVELGGMPLDLRRKFEELEELVNGQVFALTDSLEAEIAAIPLSVTFEDGTEAPVEALQIFPQAGTISFGLHRKAGVPTAP